MKLLFLSLLFPLVTLAKGPCGTAGTLEERIKDCDEAKGDFVLVSRDAKGGEIFKDTKSGLIWGDRISTDFNHYGSQRACSSDAFDPGTLKDLKWRLPTVKEFQTAASHGMKNSLPRMEHWYWTSTPVKAQRRVRRRKTYLAQAFMWSGVEEKYEAGDLKDAASVRCVAN
jgi:hypothetical protein